MEQTQFTQEELDAMFSQPSSKYNTSVKITDEDRKAGVRVLCKEPYAQELYDLYSKYDGGSQFTSKDFTVGQLCSVTAKSIDFENKMIIDRKSTRLNSSHSQQSRMPSSA